MIPRIHRWRVPFEDAAPPRSTSHSPLPHHQADPACEPQFLVNLRILLARNVRCAYKCVVLPDLRGVDGEDPRGLVSMHLQVRGAP